MNMTVGRQWSNKPLAIVALPFHTVNLRLDLVISSLVYVAAVNGCSWDSSISSANRPPSRGLSHCHMSKPLMYEPLSLCFNAFKWSCESSRTSPISEPAVKTQSHLLPWWTERVHRKWNWKSIRHTPTCTHPHTHTHAHSVGHISHFKAL